MTAQSLDPSIDMQNTDGPDAIDRYRTLLRDDATLQAELGNIEELMEFVDAARAQASSRGIAIAREALVNAARPNPLGLPAMDMRGFTRDAPPTGWLPVRVAPFDGHICVDWAYVGPVPIREPLFDVTRRAALGRPLSRLIAFRTLLSDLPRHAAASASRAPRGFIFHMSRCGSTLVAQMLAADPRNIVLSEPDPIDAVLRLPALVPGLADDVKDILLKAIVQALGRVRAPDQRDLFVKLDSWHAMYLPTFRRIFPDVPWVFLYRDPAPVLRSQMVERGVQTLPEFLPPSLFGLEAFAGTSSAEYCARVIGRICNAAADYASLGGGLFVNYAELPHAVAGRILPHFSVAPDAPMLDAMKRAVPFDAKRPGTQFAERRAQAPSAETDALPAIAERHMGHPFRRLEVLRLECTTETLPA